ncbi:MAG: guanine deaminase [Rhizobiaceae bacterium]
MSERLIRGRVLSFNRAPQAADDYGCCDYHEDGAVLVSDGLIVASGDHDAVAAKAGPGVIVDDHRPSLVLPGLIDTHIHYPQMQVIGSWGAKLLDWLNTYTFVEEQKFVDEAHAERIAGRFFDELVRAGTTTAVTYCSVHRASAEAYFNEAMRRGLRMIGGKVMMDRNAPEALRDTPQSGYDDTKALIAEWHGQGRCLYAITPRFAITSSPEQLEMSGALVAEHPDCYMQTHLSENDAEIAFARELYPDAPDYTGIYERYGLLGRKSLFGHSIHLSERERSVMAESGSIAVFCPTSNLFLGSGLFDMDGLSAAGVRSAVATDVGGGTSLSMLKTLDEAYKVLQLRGQKLAPLKSFYLMTRGNAEALELEDRIGTLAPGSEADIAVLDSRATPAMRLRMETATTLSEELFILQTMGDDRAVAETYVAGAPAKSTIDPAG